MKRSNAYFCTLGVLLSTLLASCSFSVKALTTPPPEVLSSPTAASPVELATQPPITVPESSPAAPLVPIRVETVSMLQNIRTFTLGEVVRDIAFSPDSAVLAAAGGNEQPIPIRIWNLSNDEPVGELDGHTGIVWDLAFSPDGQRLASVSSDQTAKVWDWRSQSLAKTLDFPGQVVSVSFAPDGRTLAVGGVDEMENQIQHAAIWTFSVNSWGELLKFYEFLNMLAMTYSPDGKWLVGGGTSRNVQVWRVSDGVNIFTLNHAHQVTKATISPDSTVVATGTCLTVVNEECTEGGIWLWDLLTGRLLKKLGGFPDTVVGLTFIDDGSMLVAASRDGTVRFYESSADQILHQVVAPNGLTALALSADSTLLATGHDNGEIELWQVASP